MTKSMRVFLFLVFACCISTGISAYAKEYTVGQRNKEFTVKTVRAKVGDKVKFTNEDPFAHNIFSLSETQSFDLGSYPKGDIREVTLKNPGKIDVECAIHPTMHMVIEVE